MLWGGWSEFIQGLSLWHSYFKNNTVHLIISCPLLLQMLYFYLKHFRTYQKTTTHQHTPPSIFSVLVSSHSRLCSAMYCNVSNCIVLYCIALNCIALYCIGIFVLEFIHSIVLRCAHLFLFFVLYLLSMYLYCTVKLTMSSFVLDWIYRLNWVNRFGQKKASWQL